MSAEWLAWEKLDEKHFQQLVGELMQSLAGWLQFKQGPRRGADGGWDGRLEGRMPLAPDLDPGVWMIEAKHLGPASKPIERRLREALKGTSKRRGALANAIEAGADYLLLVTSADLRADAQARLEALNDARHLRRVLIADRSSLEPLVRDRRWLLAAFFDQRPAALVPLERWTARMPFRHMAYHAPSELGEALPKLMDNTHALPRAVVLYGPGGAGKSALLSNLGAIMPIAPDGREVLGLSLHGAGSDAAEQLRRLHHGGVSGRYAIVIDDAEVDFDSRVAPVVQVAVAHELDVVFVLTARTGAQDGVDYRLMDLGLEESVSVALPQLGDDERLALLRAGAGKTHHDEEQLLAIVGACGHNLALLAHASTMLSEGRASFDFSTRKHVLRSVAERLLAQAQEELRGAPKELVERLLAGLAAIGEAWPDDVGVVASLVAERSADVSADDVSGWIERLVTNGVLARVGRVIRFGSDIEGDLLLFELTRDTSALLEELASIEGFTRHEGYLRQLAILARNGSRTAEGIARRLVRERFARALNASESWGISEPLATVVPLAAALPDLVLSRVEELINTAPGGPSWARKRLQSQLVRIVQSAVHGGGSPVVDHALTTLAAPYFEPVTSYDDPAARACADWVNPYEHGIAVPRALLNWATSMAARATPSAGERRLAVALLAAFVSPTVRYTRLRPNSSTVTLYTRCLPDAGSWAALNTEAWEVVERVARVGPSRELRTVLLGRIGHLGVNTSTVDAPLGTRADEWRSRILKGLAVAAAVESEPAVLGAIHDLAMWFCTRRGERPIDQEHRVLAMAVVNAIRHDLALDVFLCLFHAQRAVDDPQSFAMLSGEERAMYGRYGDARWLETHRRVASRLADAVKNAPGLARFLVQIAAGQAPFNGYVPPLVWSMAEQHFALVDALIRDDSLLTLLPASVRRMFELVWLHHAPDSLVWLLGRVGELAEATLEDVDLVLTAALIESRRGDIEGVLSVFMGAASHPDERVRLAVLERAKFWQEADAEQRMALIVALVGEGATGKLLQAVEQLVDHHAERVFVGADRQSLTRVLLKAVEEGAVSPDHSDGEARMALLLWSLEPRPQQVAGTVKRLLGSETAQDWLFWSTSDRWRALGLADEMASGLFETVQEARAAGLVDEYRADHLSRTLAAAYPAFADRLFDELLASPDSDLGRCRNLLGQRPVSETGPRWIALARRAVETAEWPSTREAFLTATAVNSCSHQGDEGIPQEFANQTKQLARLLALAKAGGCGSEVIGLVGAAQSSLDRRVEHWKEEQTEHRDGLRRRR